jgi:hypothetical protein
VILAKFCRNAIVRDTEPPDIILYTDPSIQSYLFIFCISTRLSSRWPKLTPSQKIGGWSLSIVSSEENRVHFSEKSEYKILKFILVDSKEDTRQTPDYFMIYARQIWSGDFWYFWGNQILRHLSTLGSDREYTLKSKFSVVPQRRKRPQFIERPGAVYSPAAQTTSIYWETLFCGKDHPPLCWEGVNLGYLEERRVEMQKRNRDDLRDGSVYNMISGRSVSRPIAFRQNFAKIKTSRHPFRVWVSPSREPSWIYCNIISPNYLPREFA